VFQEIELFNVLNHVIHLLDRREPFDGALELDD